MKANAILAKIAVFLESSLDLTTGAAGGWTGVSIETGETGIGGGTDAAALSALTPSRSKDRNRVARKTWRIIIFSAHQKMLLLVIVVYVKSRSNASFAVVIWYLRQTTADVSMAS